MGLITIDFACERLEIFFTVCVSINGCEKERLFLLTNHVATFIALPIFSLLSGPDGVPAEVSMNGFSLITKKGFSKNNIIAKKLH